MRLVSASEMQAMDRMTIEEVGIPGAVLMENAGRAASRVFLAHFDPPPGAGVVLLCGRGNNGGDGYVMARYLAQAGMRPQVIVLADSKKIAGDALLNLTILRKLDLDIQEVPGPEKWENQRHRLEKADFVIDGIFGTGLNSPVRGFYGAVIEEVNAAGKPVLAIDIPSGLHADSGQIMGVAVKADLTVTFGFPKVGQVVYPGAGLVGRLVRIDIGIPETVSASIAQTYRMTEPDDFRSLLADPREDTHKGHRGHLFVLAGSTGKTGAATLSALAALRAGAGLVTLGIPESLNPILEGNLIEAMTAPLPDSGDGTLSLAAQPVITEWLRGKSALALGPGLSTHPETVSLVREIVRSCPIPMVIDADGLNALAAPPPTRPGSPQQAILTPHPGEMARLTGLETGEIQKDRIGTVRRFVDAWGCCLVLKGARTLVAGPEGPIYVNPTGNSALASGGSGDVLTGLIGGFLARGFPPERAAAAGVYLHGLAADVLASERGNVGVLAGDLLAVIPRLMADLSRGKWPRQPKAPHADFYGPL